MMEIKCECVHMLSGGKWDKTIEQSRRVYGIDGLCPTLHTCGGGNQEVKVLEPCNGHIRKLTPLECYRLMGFDDSDHAKAVAAGISNSQLYKQVGNSIVVDVLEAIFGMMMEE